MAVFVFANNASTTLAAPIASSATTLTVAAGTGAEFPNPSVGPPQQQFAATLNDAATGLLTEIVYCTARTGDSFTTIVRAQEGTVAQNWLAGDLIANLLTAGQMQAMQQTSALSPGRTISPANGPFALSNSDGNGGVGLKSTGATSTTLPATALDGMTFQIEDLSDNFNSFNCTVAYPGGTTGPNGAVQAVLNVAGQCAHWRFYADSNTWSFKP